MMSQFIICFGWQSDCEIVDAADLKTAQAEAVKRSMAEGLMDDDLPDTTWSEPFDYLRARDLGLLEYDEPRSHAEMVESANPKPWRDATSGWRIP